MICFGLPPLRVDLSLGLPPLRMDICFGRKKNLPTSDPLGFSHRTLFCLASEAFMIVSSAVADGFSTFDFLLSPDPCVLVDCFSVLSWNLSSC